MAKKHVIKFIKAAGPYTPGDIAGFDSEEQAARYVKAKVAETYISRKEDGGDESQGKPAGKAGGAGAGKPAAGV